MLVRIKRMVKLNSEQKSCALNAIILYSHWRKLNSGAVVAAVATPSAQPELHLLILTHLIVFLLPLPLPLLYISTCFLLFSFYFLIFNTLKLNSKLFINIECILLLLHHPKRYNSSELYSSHKLYREHSIRMWLDGENHLNTFLNVNISSVVAVDSSSIYLLHYSSHTDCYLPCCCYLFR